MLRGLLLNIFFLNCLALAAQIKFPLEVKSGHLISTWQVAGSSNTRVFLELGFPTLVIDKHFADQHLAGQVTFKEPNQQNSIVLWAEQKQHQIISLINDSIHVNGKKIFLNAVVADLSLIPEWKEYDMIFPIKELGQVIKINLQNLSLEVGGDITLDASSCVWKMQPDSDTKGLFMYGKLEIFDSCGMAEKLSRNFLLDLGAANAFYLNSNHPEVEQFLERSKRMKLDESSYKTSSSLKNINVLVPEIVHFQNVEIFENHIVSIKLYNSGRTENYFGIIGIRFLENFETTIDFSGNILILKPITSVARIIK